MELENIKYEETELEDIKAEVYEDMAAINRAFQQIFRAIARLAAKGVIDPDYVWDQGIITNDLWARINSRILASINAREEDDRKHYGKMRTTLEKRAKGHQRH
jgi:ribosomal protein S20